MYAVTQAATKELVYLLRNEEILPYIKAIKPEQDHTKLYEYFEGMATSDIYILMTKDIIELALYLNDQDTERQELILGVLGNISDFYRENVEKFMETLAS